MKLNDEQQMLQDSVARLMADKGPVSHLRELRDRNDEKGYDEPLWHAMVESGLTGILVPEEHGGCLLYTSPSPRDRTRSRMPSSA